MIEELKTECYVDNELVATYTFRNTSEGVELFRYLFAHSYEILNISSLGETVPSIGMKYVDSKFIDGDQGQTFTQINPVMVSKEGQIYAFIIDQEVYYIFPVLSWDQKLIALFDSNATFKIIEGV